MTCARSRRPLFLLAAAVFGTAMPTPALVPSKSPTLPIPPVALTRVRDARSTAYTVANPLAGVVPANVAARKAAGALTLSVLDGTFDYPVLPGKFLDSGADPWTPADLANELFQPGYTGLGRPGSLRDYYNEVSYGHYLIDGAVFAWSTVAQNASFYEGAAGCNGLCTSTTDSAGGFVDELIRLNDGTVDFSQYDNDGPDGLPNSGDDDGVVDFLVVVHDRAGAECGGGGLWSHAGRYSDWFPSSYTTDDAAFGGGFVLIEDYALVSGLDCDGSSLVTIGPFAHLFGLHLGFPALWDRDGSSRGAGAWDVMARGLWGGNGVSSERPTHPSAYTKALAGWIDPTPVTGLELGASLPASETNALAREFRRPDACSHEEYFLLENRQATGFDSLLPGSGLLIWHADDQQTGSDEESRQRLHLVPADARYGLDNGRNDGDLGDPWPGSTGRLSWRDDTDPDSRRWSDRPSGVSVNNISVSGDPMTADLSQDSGPLPNIDSVSFDDGLPGLGDGDGAIDPFETVSITVSLANEGQADATGVSGVLSLATPVAGVTITDANATWPDLAPCGAGTDGVFEISLDASVACETALDFQLDLTTNEGTFVRNFSLRVGKLFDAPTVSLTNTAEDSGGPRVASRGSEAAVVYEEPVGGRSVVRMARVDDTGTLLGTTDISAGTVGNAQAPDVDWNGTEYGVVWDDDRDGTEEIYFARVDTAGVRIGSEVRVTTQAGSSSHPRVAWNGVDSQWGIVWEDTRGGNYDVYFARLDSAGVKSGTDALIAGGAGNQRHPDLSWNDQRYGMTWQDDASGEWTIQFLATDAAGTVLTPVKQMETEAGDSIRPAIAWNATGVTFGVIFIDYAAGKTRPFVRATRMTQDATLPVTVKPVSEAMSRVDGIDIDSDGVNHFIVWTDQQDGHRTLRLSRTDDRFNIQLDALVVANDTAHAVPAAIDFGSAELFTAWVEEDAVNHRFNLRARPFNTSFECGRDDDGDGVTQPGDNCPQTPNADQADADSDNWGDVCDCDDVDPNVNPGQPETICDNIDNDCDAGTVDAPDGDADGVDLCDVTDANNPDGVGVDCDDADPLNFPGNTEVCDGQDNDCDASVDEDFPVLTWYRDADLDTYGDPAVTLDTCDGNNQGYVADNTDCDDTRADVNPGELEACNGVDSDCDGSIDEITGTRYVDDLGSDAGNDCTDQLSPCVGLGHAIRLACDGETVLVDDGDYTEDVVIDHPVVIDNLTSGSVFLHGTGSTDVVKILSSGVTFEGVNTDGAPNDACIRVGDASHTGLRDINIRNTSAHDCAVGIHLDSTGSTGGWNRILSMDIHSARANGNADSGTGVLLTGGNGKLEIKVGFLRNNEGPGLRVKAPPQAATNQTLVVVGNRVQNNGFNASADGHAGLEIHDATDVRIEGNRIYDNDGPTPSIDGQGTILDNVAGGNFFCNRVEDNDDGLILRGGSNAIGVLHNKWIGHSGTGLGIEAASGTATAVNENIFSGNATAVDNAGDGTLDARHDWWGAADGPGGTAGGSGDPVTGAVDTSDFIARASAPVLVKRPVDFGWSESVSACREKIQNGINNSIAGDLLLVGAGDYREHVVLDKALEIQGISGGAGCSPSEVNGIQSGGSHTPAFRVTNVDGLTLTDLTIRSAGEGTVCGQNSGEEIGLDLQNVDNSTFDRLCIKENGVTELRVYGDSDGNNFTNLDIDGMIRLPDGTDTCGHRSREGILVDGGPSCEGGPGAIADGNVFDNIQVNYAARGVTLRLADGTELGNSTVTASPAAAWDGGLLALGVFVSMANSSNIHDNVIGAGEENDAVRVAGKDAASCVTERTDSSGTQLLGNDIADALGAGIRLYRQAGDPGSPLDTDLQCNDLRRNGTGVLVEHVGPAPSNRLSGNDITSNTEGVRNTAVRTLDATDNWWGSPTGPSGSGSGSGDSVFGSVTFNPWHGDSLFIDNDVDTFAECDGDCNDADAAINPNASEICDDIDNNCDGSIDEGLATNTYYRDADSDGFGDPASTTEDCSSTPPTGYVTDNTDCDDTDGQSYPGAPEIACDAIDQGCDGTANEAPDGDGDGYDQCDPTDPFDGDGLQADCNDGNDQVNPGVAEIDCDGTDQDCSGADSTPDGDSDGADICGSGDANNPDGLESDCDDTDPQRAPNLSEVCDSIDNDCDGTVDDGLPLNTYYRDADSDGYGDAAVTVDDCAAVPPTGYVTDNTDCDDTAAAVNPGAVEVCSDDIDNDCDGSKDAADAVCSGLDVANLVFSTGSKTTLSWDAAVGASSYGIYRGEIPGAGFAGYDHLCRASEVSGTTAEQAELPDQGRAFYYLATGLETDGATGAITGGPLGAASSGATRPESTLATCGPRVYVDPDATGLNTGLSWADAYTTVSAALGHPKATDRGLELWVKGTVPGDPGVIDSAQRGSVHLLGGFAGTELNAWERDVALNPSRWQGTGAGPLLSSTHVSVVIEGLTLSNTGSAVSATTDGQRIELREAVFETTVDQGLDLRSDGAEGGSVIVSGSSFDASSTQGIRLVAEAGSLSGRIEGNTFSGSSDAALRLEARPTATDSSFDVAVLGNTITGGAQGIVLGAHVLDAPRTATVDSLVASNLVYGTSGDGIMVEATGDFSTEAGSAAARAVPLLIGNTVSDAGDAGVRASATRTDTTADPSLHEVRSAPEIWDTLLTFLTGSGIAESTDDPATNLVADPLVVGNLFFGNGSLYLDEGTTTLPTIADVNALTGARDNSENDPLYVDRGLSDYHLQAGSPAVDQGHSDAPAAAPRDIDGESRVKDGDSDGTATPDIGADER